ncbi:hypothetical protein AB4Y45_25485 [Paraburkholderia sp. EG287A]|uniref:hypothetical protein n=1 Tax=unclassified Paraburkholderia TaxID=2615204 RepID=UPI0034D34A2D
MSTPRRNAIRFIPDSTENLERVINGTLRKWAAASRCNRPGPWIALDLAAMPDAEQEMHARNLMTVRPLPCECNE